MNARWFRDNLSVIAFVVGFLVVLGGLIWFLREASGKQATVIGDLKVQQDELSGLLNAKDPPSEDNVNIVRRDCENLNRLYTEMRAAATHDPITAPELARDIDFAQLMVPTVDRLTREASRQNVRLPTEFSFGFSRYKHDFPCRNPVARGKDCEKLLALLGKQMVVVEKISTILFKSRVEALTAIRRTEVEPGTPSADSLSMPIADDPKSLYTTYPFEVQFTCDTDGLRNFINNLSHADCLLLVRSLKIDSHAVQIRLSEPAAPGSAAPPPQSNFGPGPGAPGGADMGKPAESTRTSETRRLDVTMRLDLVEFNQQAEKADQKGKR